MFLQLILHWFGDYILQSDWMALNKTKKDIPCLVHCFIYTFPFILILHADFRIAFIIFWSHYLIDRYSLAKYIIWIKNHLNPTLSYAPWKFCNKTGYNDHDFNLKDHNTMLQLEDYNWISGNRPLFITVWLYIITDNGLHILINYLAFKNP